MGVMHQMLMMGYAASTGDPLFSQVTLLVGNSPTLIDASPVGRTITAGGNAAISTTNVGLGPYSLVLDGSGDYASWAVAADMLLSNGSGDAPFTIEALYNAVSLPGSINSSGGAVLAGNYVNSSNGFILGVAADGLNFYYRGDTRFVRTAASISTGAVHHSAVCFNGTASNALQLFHDGAPYGAVLNTGSAYASNSNGGAIGSLAPNFTNTQTFTGNLIVRITRGVGGCRYTGSYTPPTSFPLS